MRDLAERLILLCSLTCLLATGASAQIVVQGVVRPEDVPPVQSDQIPDAARPSQPWSLGLGAGHVFDSKYESSPEVHGLLSRSWEGRRAGANFASNVSYLLGQSTGGSQLLYGMGVAATYRFSPRVTWNLGDTLTSSYARETTALSDSDLLPPNILTRLNTASSDLGYALSRRTQVHWGLSHQTAAFGSSQVRGGSSFSTRFGLSRQASRSQTFGVDASYQRAVTDGAIPTGVGVVLIDDAISTVEALNGTWQLALGKRSSLNGSAGFSIYAIPGQDGVQSAPAFAVGFNTTLGRKDNFGVHYDRAIETALGVGTHLTNGVTATYGLSLGSRLALTFEGDYATGTYPFDPDHKLIGRTVVVGLQYTPVTNLVFNLGSSVYLRTDTPNPALIKTYRTMISVTYGKKLG
jgi:hypothetical protein